MHHRRSIAVCALTVGVVLGATAWEPVQADTGADGAGSVIAQRPSDSTFGIAVVRSSSGEALATKPLARRRGGNPTRWECRYFDEIPVFGDREQPYLSAGGKGPLAGELENGKTYVFDCIDVTDPENPTPVRLEPGTGWRRVTYDGNPGAPLDSRPEVQIAAAFKNISAADFKTLENPDVEINPTDQLIGVPTWFFVKNYQDHHEVRVGGGLDGLPTATITARKRANAPVTVRPDRGADEVPCDGPGVSWQDSHDERDPRACRYTYWHVPPKAPDGSRGTYTATVTIYYDVSWTATGGGLDLEGDLPTVFAQTDVPITARAVQAVTR